MPVALRLADPEGEYAAVRLASDLRLSDRERSFRRTDGEWVLELEPPEIARLEYQLEVERTAGGTERLCDPGNPLRAPGAFGDKSVLELDGYAPPAWLEEQGVPGRADELAVRGRGLGAHIAVRVWSPVEGPARMLLANDGPEYDALARLTQFCAVVIAREALPPFRVALLAPGDRDQWYSASAAYSRALAHDVIPALRDGFGIIGPVAGVGASLGGLAMLHAQRRFPRALGALF